MDFCESHGDVRQLLDVGLGVLCSIQQGLGLLFEHINFILKYADLVLQVTLLQLIDVDNIVVSVLANGAPEANATGTVFAEAFHVLAAVVEAPEHIVVGLTVLLLLLLLVLGLAAGAARC